MTTKMTLSECFARFGAAGSNPRWSWSARDSNGTIVVITLWQDRLKFDKGIISYHDVAIDTDAWKERPGNKERLDNLKWARDHCNGYFKTVITIAEDVNKQPRKIKECFPKPEYNMQLIELNEQTGEFRAQHIKP